MKSTINLDIYHESILLCSEVFKLTKLPLLKYEYEIKDQIKRAAISVCANIAEGYGRKSKADFGQFLSISLGSTNEIVAFLDIISVVFPTITINTLTEKYTVLGKRIYSYRKKLY